MSFLGVAASIESFKHDEVESYEPMRSDHGDLLKFWNFRSLPSLNDSCKSVFWRVLVLSGKLSIRIQLSLIDRIRMWGDSMLEMKQWPVIPFTVRFKSLYSSWLLVPKLPKTSTSSAGREQPDFQAFFELFRDPKHGWVFLIVYANPLASMFLNSRSDAVNSPWSLPLCFLFFPFPFGPIPCRSCAKRRTTDDEKGGILFFFGGKTGIP